MPVNMGTASGSLNLSAKGFVDGINTAITALEKLKTKADDVKENVKEFGDEATNTKSKTDSLGNKTKEAGEKVKNYGDKVKGAKGDTKGLGDQSDTTKEKVKKLGDSLKGVGDKLTGYGDKISKVGTGLSKYITAPAALVGGFSVKKFSDFESAMSAVQATSGASAEDMIKLSDKAKQMGETTKFSATEAAEALNYMAMAGWKTDEMLSGIDGIMNLAAASGENLANVSDIVTDALTGFGLTAKDSSKFADALAAASSNANTNVSMLGESFKYVAPVAGALGYSAEDVAINLGLMANSGIKGGQAGTALRAALSRLIKPTDDVMLMMKKLNISMTDSNGKVKSLRELNGDLRTSFSKLSDAEQAQAATILFGQEAMSGMLAIIRASDGDYNKLTKAIDNSQDSAKKMSEIRMDNFSGQLTLLKSKAEGVGIQFGEQIVPYLSKFVDKIGDILNWFSKLDDSTKNLIIKWGGLLAALGPTLKIFGNITKAAGGLSKAFGLIANHPIVAATALIAGGIAAITTAMTDNIETVPKEYNAYKEFSDEVRKTAAEFKNLKEARKKAIQDVETEYDHYEDLKNQLDKIVDANGKIKEGYENRAKFLTGELSKATGIEIENNGKIIKNYQDISKQIDKTIQKRKIEAQLEAYRESYTTAIKNQKKAEEDLWKATKNMNEAKTKYRDLEKQIADEEKELAELKKKVNPTRDDTKRMSELNDAIADGKDKLNQYRDELSNANTDWLDAQATYTNYATTIKNYEELNTALITDDEKKIKTAQQNLVNDFVTAENGTKSSLSKQYKNWQEHYDTLLKEVQSGNKNITQDAVNNAKEMVEKSKIELDKYNGAYKGTTDNIKTQLFYQLANAEAHYKDMKALVGRQGYGVTQDMVKNAKDAVDGIKAQFNGLKSFGETVGNNLISGLSTGIQSGQSPSSYLHNSIFKTTNSIKDWTKKNLGIASPSKITKQFGVWFVQGFANGIKDSIGMIDDATSEMTNVALAAFSQSPNNFVIDKQSFGMKQSTVDTRGAINSNQSNTFNIYSPKPIGTIETVEEIKKIQKQLAEGFIT